MKKIYLLLLLSSTFVQAQVAGNALYSNGSSNYTYTNYSSISKIDKILNLTVSGKANVKADAFIAIFALKQTGKNIEETVTLMDNKLKSITQNLSQIPKVETQIDMISLVPLYEYEIEKKVFKKNDYNEVPIGFELCKNIHIKYCNANDIDHIVRKLAEEDIYDLVKVNYFSSKIDSIKRELQSKAEQVLLDKIKHHETVLNTTFNNQQKFIKSNYIDTYPSNSYHAYSAFSSPSLTTKQSSNNNVNQQTKSITRYYNSFSDANFDFVIGQALSEPSIQIIYEITMAIDLELKKNKLDPQEIKVLTPNGDLKTIQL
ncbi:MULTISPECIES: SIMPL domain-containing protein [Myroides]|uniref:DUF541 domain-containing protein n=1 Tax=Myroides albus TaxID=2562892 RepID=A0A6I3LK19_9FLAO|nr:MULTISPECIES: SIMPL domain-containing protein [Myroides]MTG97570.1 DUF541 domain-containing protein [Myroides albus]MVX36107.1 DUF541 domain-containing protein [Myroides sp. LoEW2-1]UVD81155.1 SIMPL domain-containing protein [Myroides albus]